MGNKVNRLVLIVAIVAGFASFILAYSYLESYKEHVSVVVLTRDVRMQEVLRRSDVRTVQIQKDAVHPSAYRDTEQLFGKDGEQTVVARDNLYSGQQLIRPAVELGSEARNLSFKLREQSDGHTQARAYALRGTPENTFGGRLEPGDRVDVIFVFNKGGVLPEAVSKRVFLNVKVLDISFTNIDANRRQIDLITLLFEKPEDVELFSMMQQYASRINLTLVPIGGGSSITRGYDSYRFLEALGLSVIHFDEFGF